MQSQVAGLRSASLNIARTASQVSAAEGGVTNVSRILGRLQDLATRASGAIDANARRGLDIEFQSLRSEMARVVATISFNGKLLLDGSVTAEDLGLETDDPTAGLPDLSEKGLFGDASLSTATPEQAARTAKLIADAQKAVASSQEDIVAFRDALEVGQATIESAINNQDASRSLLDGDVSEDDFLGIQQQIQNSPALALLAQTNRVPGNISLLLAD